MKHQRKLNRWSCAITALAMALRLPVEKIVEEAGHDGGEIVFPHLSEPMCRQGFHSQELVRIAWQHGYAMTPIELFPQTMSNDGIHTHLVWWQDDSVIQERFAKTVEASFGILEGHGNQCHHAVYNSGGMLHDPDPGVPNYGFSFAACKERNFYPNRLWVFTRHK